jgi:hypothetical protein
MHTLQLLVLALEWMMAAWTDVRIPQIDLVPVTLLISGERSLLYQSRYQHINTQAELDNTLTNHISDLAGTHQGVIRVRTDFSCCTCFIISHGKQTNVIGFEIDACIHIDNNLYVLYRRLGIQTDINRVRSTTPYLIFAIPRRKADAIYLIHDERRSTVELPKYKMRHSIILKQEVAPKP